MPMNHEEEPQPAEDVINKPLGYIGTLTPDENQAILGIKHRTQQIVNTLGQLEVQKSRLLGELNDLEKRAVQTAHQAAARFGVTETNWSINPNGDVFSVEAIQQAEGRG